MKQVYLLLILLTSFIQLQSQTINPDWFFEMGQKTRTVYVSNSPIFETPIEGLNSIWDFSQAIDGGNDDNLLYTDPQDFTWSDSFPNANIGAKDLNNNIYNAFYQKEESKLLFWGSTTETNSGTPFLTIYTDPIIELECPLLYGSSIEDTYSYRAYLGDLYLNERFGMRTTTFAGTGTVITPNGTFENCFMLKIEDENDVSTPFVAYRFFKDNLSNMVASYTEQGVTSAGDILKIVSYQVGGLNITATEDIQELETELIVLNNTTLQFNSIEEIKGQFSLYTIDGKLLSNENIYFQKGSNIISVNNDLKGLIVGVLMDTKTRRFKSFKLVL